MSAYITLIRVKHWIKNLFLFLPLFFSGHIFDSAIMIGKAGIGFLLFSLIASAVYIINDIQDAPADRIHPEKKKRPVASGMVKVNTAIILAALLITISIAGAYLLNIFFVYILIIYFAMNIAYSYGLKHIPIIDITIIAIGFLLRIIGGGVIADVFISQWIVVMTFLLALFLGIAKRREDVILFQNSGQKTRASITGYNLEFINSSMVLMAAVVIVAYLMYTMSADVIERFNTPYLYVTSVFVILGVLRYLQITFVQNKSGNPTQLLWKDLFIQLVLLGWVLAFFLIIYFQKIQ
jgi:4-hydroxybenzoate polyprenyltransferase